MIIRTAFACIICFKRYTSVYRVYRNICAREKLQTAASATCLFYDLKQKYIICSAGKAAIQNRHD